MEQVQRSFNPWPALHPPELTRLANNPPSSDINTPASSRYRATQNGTLQDEIDKLDWEEEQWYQSVSNLLEWKAGRNHHVDEHLG